MLEPNVRTPIGGMNQDDSLVTPSMDAAGKNMFEAGDYRYALNARIGSSRSDHFGDLENIRDTLEVTDYYAAQNLFTNPSFEGSLTGWSQLDESVDFIPWTYNNNAARLTLTPDIGPVAAPTFIIKSTQVSVAGTGGVASNVDLAYPALQAGDLLIIQAVVTHPGATLGSITMVTGGWTGGSNTGYDDSGNVYAGNLSLFRKTAIGTETGNVTVQGFADVNFTLYAQMYVFRSSSGEDVQLDSSSMKGDADGASTITYNAVTVSDIHRTLLAFLGGAFSSPPAPTGYTEVAADSLMRLFTKADVSSDGAVTSTGGSIGGWATGHFSLFAEGNIETQFTSEVLYQTLPASFISQPISAQFGINSSGPITDCVISIVYLNGTSIVSEEVIFSGTITDMNFNEALTSPASSCDGIGIRIEGKISTATILDLEYSQVIGTFLALSTRPAGNEKVIGKYEDYEFQRLYYCVWNDQNNHCIRYYDALNNYIVEVLQWSGLNWESDYFVKMAKLDNWVAFTDRNNPPRLIDVDTIAALKAELGSEFREFHISFHKWAPTVPPIPRIYYDGTTNNFEFLKDKVFHFAYRYIYNGNLKSRWSPISKGATTCGLKNTFYADNTITAIEVDIPGAILDDPGAAVEYNYFDHTDLKFTSVVKYIELAFTDGEQELWKYWKRITVTPSFERLHYFTGSGLLTPIPQDDFTQPFDTVPFLAGTVEAIDNRFVFGDCLDEKPPVTNLLVDDVSHQFGLDEWQDPRTTSFATIAATPRAKLQRLNALSSLTFKDRAHYKFGIQFLYPTGWRTGVYTSEEWFYSIPDVGGQQSGAQNLALQFTLPSTFIPPQDAIGYQIMRTNALNISYYIFGIVNTMNPIIDDVSTILDQVELPQNVKDRISEHFRNVQNISANEVIEQTQKVIQDEVDANARRDRRIRRRNRFLRRNTIFNFVNSGVGHGLTTALIEKWGRRTPVGPRLLQELRKTKTISAIANASRIHIDINNWIFGAKEDTDEEFPLNKLFYNYVEGDRVRFVGSDVASPTADDLKEYDVPILEFTGKGIIIERPESLQWISSPTVLSPRNFNIEIYTPRVASEQDHIFYEMGEWYPVLFPGTANRDFSKRDFVYTNEAGVTVSQYGPFDIFNKMPVFYGDSYNVQKTVYRDDVTVGWVGANSSPIFISMNPDLNKTFDYWDKNNGRVSIAYDDLPVVRFKLTQCRFGGKIVEESFVNNLNNMRDEDQFVYPSEYGRIRDLVNTANAQVESVGAILLAIGEREAWSIYVNRTTLEDLSGRTQVILSDDVLGSYNTLLGSHGTLNPESVSRSRGRVYWWNALDGSWVRYGRDGITELSEYKMRNWFSELGELMITKYLTDELPTAISEFDPFNRELVTFQNHSTLPATFRGYSTYKGATFSETDTRWKMCHSLTPEMFGKMNNQFISFKGGSVFLHERGPAYSTFYGTKHNVQWEPVFNDMPYMKKAWKAIAVVATNKWSVERVLSEYRGLKNKQQTSISLDKFVEKEDNYYCEMNRDINTPNTPRAIIEGDVMRSKAIQVLMQLDPAVTYESLLHYVFMEITDSKKNP